MDSTKICHICKLSDDNPFEVGEWHSINGKSVHYFCVLLSNNLLQRGRDDEGVLGFLWPDIDACERLIRRHKCAYCKKRSASVWCDRNTQCKRFFHVSCGMKNGCLFQFSDAYQSFCERHHNIDDSERTKHDEHSECYICFEPLGAYNPITSIPSCCDQGWFHRNCIKEAAIKIGLLLHCPLCGEDKEGYRQFVASRGIYTPHQDAAWEQTKSAFKSLLYTHSECNAPECLCKKGRCFEGKKGDWRILLCSYCGSYGSHKKCLGDIDVDEFECEPCKILSQQAQNESVQDTEREPDGADKQLEAEYVVNIEHIDIDDRSDGDDAITISSNEVVWKGVESKTLRGKPLSLCLVKANQTPSLDPIDDSLLGKMRKRRLNHFFQSPYALKSVNERNCEHYHIGIP